MLGKLPQKVVKFNYKYMRNVDGVFELSEEFTKIICSLISLFHNKMTHRNEDVIERERFSYM